ncbi:hypothetical protein ACFLWX_02885 [Chloroflexota bacterium]
MLSSELVRTQLESTQSTVEQHGGTAGLSWQEPELWFSTGVSGNAAAMPGDNANKKASAIIVVFQIVPDLFTTIMMIIVVYTLAEVNT